MPISQAQVGSGKGTGDESSPKFAELLAVSGPSVGPQMFHQILAHLAVDPQLQTCTPESSGDASVAQRNLSRAREHAP